MSKSVTRLFQQFQPSRYDLQLRVDPRDLTFSGNVVIVGKKVGRPSQRITLHQKGLTIVEATMRRSDKKGEKVYDVSRINKQDSYDEVRLHASELLYPGEYTLMLTFTGKITRNMEGIYPCFFEQDGTEQKLIATQFESHHAREAFPCIDEPEAKAVFQLSLITPSSPAVISNTPIEQQEEITGELEHWTTQYHPDDKASAHQRTTFEETPRMSTYLFAFAFGDMKYLEAKTKDGVLVRTYATPDNVQYTDFALDVAVKCLEFYNDYFAIPYPLPKCDFIALPDFSSGAMENWGCITFREQALIVDPQNTSLPMKQWVANVIAHELTHQWFGNLVTMKWWNDLWLNESFASWMSYLAIDHLFPEWKVWEDFIVSEQSQAMRLDALENTHPINVTIKHPDEIRTIFDAISYEKGASVILMLKQYLGDEAFRDGLRLYLKRHAYSNTESTDLFAAWEEISKKPVQDFMHAWTTQPGYPLLSTTVNEHEMRVKQERFYLNREAEVASTLVRSSASIGTSEPANQRTASVWPVPLNGRGININTIEKSDQIIPIDDPHTLIMNDGHSGFFRTVYDSNQIARIKTLLQAGKLSPLNRLGLLADSFEAAKAGYTSTVDTLELLEAYKSEDNVFVWEVMVGVLGSIRATMRDEDLRAAIKPFGRQLAAAQVKRLGWDIRENESHFDTLLRPLVLGLAAISDDEAVVAEALQRFQKMQRPEDVAPDIRGIVYGTAARKGSQKDFDKLLKIHNESKNSEDRVTLSAALTAFKQPDIIDQALAQITGKNVRLQDASYWVAYSFGNRHARDTTWQWMVDNWDWLDKNLGKDLSFSRMPNYAGRNYSDTSFLPTFTKFFGSHMSPAFERPVKQAVETIQWQSAWRSRDLASIKEFFAQ